VVARWRQAGVPVLDIPGNYYDDLRVRLGVDGALLEQLRALGVLYDVDGAGRTFLHCYTEAVGGGLFFELVQRGDGYDGYGAGNAAVRMAAQRWRERAALVS
jgi:4-hydroxyphenylpyruvate dioxygenase